MLTYAIYHSNYLTTYFEFTYKYGHDNRTIGAEEFSIPSTTAACMLHNC